MSRPLIDLFKNFNNEYISFFKGVTVDKIEIDKTSNIWNVSLSYIEDGQKGHIEKNADYIKCLFSDKFRLSCDIVFKLTKSNTEIEPKSADENLDCKDSAGSTVSDIYDTKLEDVFVVFDIETTGLSSTGDEITEIGAVKVKNNEIVGRFSELINPMRPIPENITELTGITDEMVKDKDDISKVMPRFLEFIGSCPVVAHNAKFDTGFIREKCRRLRLKYENPSVDTLLLSRWLLPELKKHKLNVVAEHLNISLINHHRAVDDAEAAAYIFIRFIEMMKKRGIETLGDMNRTLGIK